MASKSFFLLYLLKLVIWLKSLPSTLIISEQWKGYELLEFNLNERQKGKWPKPYEHERWRVKKLQKQIHIRKRQTISAAAALIIVNQEQINATVLWALPMLLVPQCFIIYIFYRTFWWMDQGKINYACYM